MQNKAPQSILVDLVQWLAMTAARNHVGASQNAVDLSQVADFSRIVAISLVALSQEGAELGCSEMLNSETIWIGRSGCLNCQNALQAR